MAITSDSGILFQLSAEPGLSHWLAAVNAHQFNLVCKVGIVAHGAALCRWPFWHQLWERILSV